MQTTSSRVLSLVLVHAHASRTFPLFFVFHYFLFIQVSLCVFDRLWLCFIIFLFLQFSSTLFCIILLFSWIIVMCQFRTGSIRKIEKERQQFRLLYQFIYNTKKSLCSTRQCKWRRSKPRSSEFMLAIYQLWIRRRVVRVIWLFYFLSLFRFRCEDLVLLLRCPRAIWIIRM